MAMASVWWASPLIEPCDMAPVLKRLTISLAGSTSSKGTGSPGTNSNMPRSVQSSLACSLTALANSSNSRGSFFNTACCKVVTVVGFHRCRSPSRRN